jgi:hypothetical protein
MGFQSIFAWKALPEAAFVKKAVIDAHRSKEESIASGWLHRSARPILPQASPVWKVRNLPHCCLRARESVRRASGFVQIPISLPGKEESAEQNHSSRSAKGNKYLRRVLNQAAHAAVAKKGSHFQAVFRRLLPRLGYQSAIWAVAHRLCRLVWKILHEGVRFIEQGHEVGPREKKKRAQMLARALRKLGYEVTITPINQLAAKPVV